MMGRQAQMGPALDEMAQSALKEMGNILCSAYLNALADFMGFSFLPSIPALAIDMLGSVLETVASDAAQTCPQALLIENRFLQGAQGVPLYLYYLPDPGSLQTMLAGLARTTGVDPRQDRG